MRTHVASDCRAAEQFIKKSGITKQKKPWELKKSHGFKIILSLLFPGRPQSRKPYQAADSLLLEKLFTLLVSREIFLEAVFL